MQSSSRHLDTGNFLTSFADEVHVKCVRCNKAGTVTAQVKDRRWAASFECVECRLHLCSSREDWVGPVRFEGRRPCGHCGHKWLLPSVAQRGWPREVIESVTSLCPECGHESIVQVVAHRIYGGGENNDPHFGMPLLLADSGRHGSLWAYNEKHLHALMSYVSASLRERGVNAGNASMFSRLPAWLKSAKNRESLTKRLAKLEQLLPNRSLEPTRVGKPPLAAQLQR